MKYGFTDRLVQSGDLRVHLALDPKNKKYLKLLEGEIDKDLIIKDGSVLTYAPGVFDAYDKFIEKVSPIPLSTGRNVIACLGGLFKGQTCVLAGCAPSLDVSFLNRLASNIPIFAIGNTNKVFQSFGWVGIQDTHSYSGILQSALTMAFYPKKYRREYLWAGGKKMSTAAKDCPNTYFFSNDMFTTLDENEETFFMNQPAVTDLGTGSSLIAAITLVTVLGFNNIILTGVQLKGELDNYYIFPEVPPALTHRRKTIAYPKACVMLDSLRRQLSRIAVRLYTTEAVSTLSRLPKELILTAAEQITGKIVSQVELPDAPTPRQGTKGLLTVVRLYHGLKRLQEKLPSFNTEEVKQLKIRIEETNKKTRCSDCQIAKLAKPLMGIWQTEYIKDKKRLIEVWQELFPESTVFLYKGIQYPKT